MFLDAALHLQNRQRRRLLRGGSISNESEGERGNFFAFEKSEVHRFGDRLGRAFDVVREFEFDLYEN
jgi:hypothetical protein